jgi:hypothetical protein
MQLERYFLITATTESSVGKFVFFSIGRQVEITHNICLVSEDEF